MNTNVQNLTSLTPSPKQCPLGHFGMCRRPLIAPGLLPSFSKTICDVQIRSWRVDVSFLLSSIPLDARSSADNIGLRRAVKPRKRSARKPLVPSAFFDQRAKKTTPLLVRYELRDQQSVGPILKIFMYSKRATLG